VSPGLLAQELFTTSGRSAGFGRVPSVLVGARMNWPEDNRALTEQLVLSQPLAAIHFAFGATPILLIPSFPTIVPIVCVPWSTLSHGVAPVEEQTCEGSHQL
jgi:hypothetical protein